MQVRKEDPESSLTVRSGRSLHLQAVVERKVETVTPNGISLTKILLSTSNADTPDPSTASFVD